MIKSLIPVICPSVESSRSPSRRRGGSPTTVIITGVRGAWIWPGCSSWSERSSTFGPSLQAHLVAQATPTCALANGSCRRPPHPSSETSRTIPSRNRQRWRNSPPGGWAPGLRHPLAYPGDLGRKPTIRVAAKGWSEGPNVLPLSSCATKCPVWMGPCQIGLLLRPLLSRSLSTVSALRPQDHVVTFHEGIWHELCLALSCPERKRGSRTGAALRGHVMEKGERTRHSYKGPIIYRRLGPARAGSG